MGIEIRRAGPGDEGLLTLVAKDVFDAAIDPARLTAFLAEPGHALVLAIDDGLVVGQARAIVHRHPDLPTELYIDNLGVAPAWQRRGLASALLDALVAWGREAGCSEAWVGTELDNVAANALYGRVAKGEAANVFMFQI